MGFSVLGGLRGRGLAGVRGYAVNGAPTNSAKYGDSITFNVPGQPAGTIWLEQYVNGALGYNGPFQIPMNPYTLSNKDQIGNWQSNAYTYQNGQKGQLLEQSTLYVSGAAQSPGVPVASGSSLPASFSCVGSDGHTYTGTDINSIRTAFNNPNWLPAGCSTVVSGSVGGNPIPSGEGGGSASNQVITVNTAPSIPGALPSGGTVGASYNQNCLSGKFRFILASGNGFATGANLPGCSQTNSANCDPQFFPTLQDAINYALSHSETPYKVDSAAEPWQLISCAIAPDPGKIYNADGSLGGGGLSLTTLLLAGAVLYFVGKSRR